MFHVYQKWRRTLVQLGKLSSKPGSTFNCSRHSIVEFLTLQLHRRHIYVCPFSGRVRLGPLFRLLYVFLYLHILHILPSVLIFTRLKDGRRPIYLISLPIMCLGSLTVALSTSVTQLAIGRILQAFGASSFMSVGPSSISDIYRLEERGAAMGVYWGVSKAVSVVDPLILYN